MTERTFRTPSPNRPVSRDKNEAPPAPPVPPLPPLPKNYSNRRAASLEPPLRVTSPTPKTPGGRGASLDRVAKKQPPNLNHVQEDNQNSINFSYPTSARPNSPPVKTSTQAYSEAASRPVKKKKKKVAPGSAEGSHLASGGMGGKPLGTEIDQAPVKKPVDLESDSPAEKRAQRASGQLNKQPSIVREDWEGEQEAGENMSPVTSPPSVRSKKQEPNISKKVEAADHPPQEPPNEHLQVSESKRTSLSPSRSTRFSAQLASELLAERKHEPPPRSLSPAKPALKHHSPSRTHSPIEGTMPGGWRRSSQTPSEASDTTSLASADGSKKKRAMHVSFNAEPSVAENAEARFGLSQLDTIEAEDDMEEVMKPRPALPSFGSIRNKKEKPEPRQSSKISVSSSASSSESYLPPTMETSVSSDHAIGALLSQNHAKLDQPAIDPKLPLPPEVTSVEGTGYASDTDVSTYSDEYTLGESAPKTQSSPLSKVEAPVPANEPGKQLTIETEKANVEEVPKIAVQPATPGIEPDQKDEWLVEVPGGFPETREPSENSSVRNHDQREINDTTPADVGVAEPKPIDAAAPVTSTVDTISQNLLNLTKGDSDAESTAGESIYSDAAEDVADLEGDGFGSINAIVESPTIKAPPTELPSPPTTSNITQPERQESWDQTQAHWTDLAERQRHIVKSPPSPRETTTQTKPKKKKKKPASAPVSSKPIEVEGPDPDSPIRAYPISSPYPVINAEPSKPGQGAIRQSMRSPPSDAEEHARQTIRPPPKSALRQSNAVNTTKSTPSEPRGALQKKTVPASTKNTTAAASAKPKPKPLPVTNDSDSESSFKRERRSRKSDTYTMRRSMRSPDAARPQSAIVSVRPTSPQTRRPFSAGGQGALRSTMRSSESGTPSLRGTRQRPTSMSGFNRSPKLSSTPTPSAALTSRFKSRFASDSDDEDVPRVFRSRFEDSSDDEPEPLSLRPVRGIPRKTDEEDSTDLDDSSEEESKPKQSKVQISSPQPGGAEAKRSEPSSSHDLSTVDFSSPKKKGLFGRFRSKKVKSDGSRVSKSTAESPARRDTHLERSRAELHSTRNDGIEPKGKLQRRTLPSRYASDSWPLPEKTDDTDRPKTSDGVVNGSEHTRPIDVRPGLAPRENTSNTLKSEGGTPIYGKSGKKKRFPMLRKAFGLHD